MKIVYKNREIEIDVRSMNSFGRFIGLMFRSRETVNLLFDFLSEGKRDLHSLFVFFPFLVLWLDGKNNLIDHKICLPFKWKISTEKPFVKVVELPFNNKNKKIIDFFVGKERFK